MNGISILVIAIVALACGYFLYGGLLAKLWKVDPSRSTPAVELEDGVDYVPTNTQVVFGHHFASIAGAAPIIGPIVASMFGWVPVLLWCLIGGVFFGAVQDFGSLFASVRKEGKTIGHLIELYVGKMGKKLFLAFSWLFSILVIAAFGDIVAKTFGGFNPDGTHSLIHGSTALTSTLFIFVSVLFGFYIKKRKPGSIEMSGIAILLLVACIGIGISSPIFIATNTWLYLVFAYCMLASVVPVWALLQPRDFLNSFLLIAMIAGALIGVFVANPDMNLVPFVGWTVKGMSIFPILFVTIACGAVSGFHSLVSSGTTSKQIKNEKAMLPIGFGAMLLETLLGILALIAVGSLATNGVAPTGSPATLFATAIANFLSIIGLPTSFTGTIMTLAISAFALTSLDSVARIGRLCFQEFFLDEDMDKEHLSPAVKLATNKYFATILTLVLAFGLAKIGYRNIWPLFGSANQMLSALALCAVALFLKHHQLNNKMVYVPMFMMLLVTYTALAQIIIKNLRVEHFVMATNGLQIIFGCLILGLGIVIGLRAVKRLFAKPELQVAMAK